MNKFERISEIEEKKTAMFLNLKTKHQVTTAVRYWRLAEQQKERILEEPDYDMLAFFGKCVFVGFATAVTVVSIACNFDIIFLGLNNFFSNLAQQLIK